MIRTAADIPVDWKQPQGHFDCVKREMMMATVAMLLPMVATGSH